MIYFGAVPPPALPPATGSSLWQLIFISFGCVLILFEILRGWRRGMPRQLARLGAIMAAYLVAYFGGPLLGPWLRPLVQMPDAILSLLAGALLALLVYAVINGLGTMFFRRTSDHESAMVRLVYGAVGAVLGLFFGAFLVWLLVVSVRSLGAVADAKVRQQSAAQLASSSPRSLHPVDLRNGAINDSGDTMPLLTSLARLKNSLELGAVGTAVKKADVVPTKAYDTLGKVGKVCSDPETAQRFLSFPGARELGENARIVALREDPEIANLISEGRFFDLLQNQRILDAANDPEVVQRVKQFDLQGALDYAINRNQ